MRVIKPTPITDSLFVSSTVPETDHAAWSSGTTYADGDFCIHNHRIWESLQGSNTNHNPSTDTSDPPYWLDTGPTNRWAMFDQVVNTSTSTTSSMQIVLQPGLINSVGLVELVGTYARVELLDGSTTVYDETIYSDATPMVDWYDYFFEPYDTATEVVFSNLPQYLTGQLRVTIVDTSGGTVSCGGLVAGVAYTLGPTEYGATAGITDYSYKSTNAFGAVTIVQRAYSKRSSQRFWLTQEELRRTYRLLADLRSTPCLWLGVEDDTETYAPLVVFGFYKEFQIEIAEFSRSFCSLEIEGMI